MCRDVKRIECAEYKPIRQPDIRNDEVGSTSISKIFFHRLGCGQRSVDLPISAQFIYYRCESYKTRAFIFYYKQLHRLFKIKFGAIIATILDKAFRLYSVTAYRKSYTTLCDIKLCKDRNYPTIPQAIFLDILFLSPNN